MRPEYYLDVARNYAGYVKHFASQSVYQRDGKLRNVKMILAELPTGAFETAEKKVKNVYFDMLSLHIYCNTSDSPSVPPQETYYKLIAQLPRLEARIKRLCDVARTLSTESHSIDVAIYQIGRAHV